MSLRNFRAIDFAGAGQQAEPKLQDNPLPLAREPKASAEPKRTPRAPKAQPAPEPVPESEQEVVPDDLTLP